METIEYHTKDKSGWGVGPWQDEPDKRQWADEATGLPCLIVRPHGSLCGYVGVPPGHWAHGVHYDDNRLGHIEVHGGLTFSRGCMHGDDESQGVCHKPAPGEPDDVWWLGFDTAHCWDVDPERSARWPELQPGDAEYRDMAYVAAQVAALAKQLAK